MTRRLSPAQTSSTIDRLGIERSLLPAFGFTDSAVAVRYAAHAHSRHQLLVPSGGTIGVETRTRLHLCDASTGIWIPAGCRHATTIGPHPAVSLFFSPRSFRSAWTDAVAIAMTPLLRHLAVAGAMEAGGLPRFERQSLYHLLFALVKRAADPERMSGLARPDSRELRAAVDYMLTHLATCRVGALARAVGMSERTLRRRFAGELHVSPEQYLQRARLLRARQLLADAGRSVLDVAEAVGYSNQSAFTAAFKRSFGVVPRHARRAP